MKYDYVRRALTSVFSRIGYQIGCHPLLFIAIPLLFSIIFVTGFTKIILLTNIEYLFIPISARSRTERAALESLFPPNLSTNYDLLRISRFGRMASIIATSKFNETMLEEPIMDDLLKLDQIIRNISLNWNNTIITYEDLCSKSIHGGCFQNFILTLKGKTNAIKQGAYRIKFPIQKTEGEPILPPINLGAVEVNKNSYVKNFKAVRFMYPLDYSTEEKKQIALLWENKFLTTLSDIQFQNIQISLFVAKAFDEEINKITEMAFPLLQIIVPVMLIFSSISSLSKNVTTSKPLLGIVACASAAISSVSGFGLLLHCGVEYADLNLAIIFLMLGIGIDDSFVLLSAWRRTNRNDTVSKRMSEAYSEAAVSVTVTSLTNFLSFCMGLTTPYRIIRIFSAYSAIAVLFDYIYQIFFFGGFMALDGYREEKNLHPILCFRIKLNSSEQNNNSKRGEKKSEENFMMVFLRDSLGTYLQKNQIKLLIVVIFIFYLSGGIYCMRWIKEGLDYVKLFPTSSYIIKYMSDHYKYFSLYPHRIHVVINQTLDYSDPTVQNDIENLLKSFESGPFVADSSTYECWLKEYLSFIGEPISRLSLSGYNLSNPEDFLDGFKNVFLKFKKARRFRKDVLFNSRGDQIIASRFFIQSYNVKNSTAETILMENVRRIADNSKFNVYVYNLWFILYDQYLNVASTCIQTISITAVLISLVFILFIPNLICATCVTITIVSIEVGVIGYMSVWDVNIDAISMIILVMCVGFCVDYSAHVSYAYVSCTEKDPNNRMKMALYAAGYPIIQGCISTILGVSVLYFGPSYLFVIFFKIILLVMIFAAFHGLILLPVILNTGDFICKFATTFILNKII